MPSQIAAWSLPATLSRMTISVSMAPVFARHFAQPSLRSVRCSRFSSIASSSRTTSTGVRHDAGMLGDRTGVPAAVCDTDLCMHPPSSSWSSSSSSLLLLLLSL